MSRVHLSEFSFELPGDGWDDLSVQSFLSPEGPAFLVLRTPIEETQPLEPVVMFWLDKLTGENAKIDLEAARPSLVGGLEAIEAKAMVYDGNDSDYFRLAVARYYDQAITFAFTGESNEARAVDTLAETTLHETTFRRR